MLVKRRSERMYLEYYEVLGLLILWVVTPWDSHRDFMAFSLEEQEFQACF